MTTTTKIYIGLGVAAVFAIGIFGGSAWSDHWAYKLELAVNDAKVLAEKSAKASAEAERTASEYRAKTEYLELQIAEIWAIARKQDEKLEKQNTNTRTARADVERSKRTINIDVGARELCTKLAEIGHPC